MQMCPATADIWVGVFKMSREDQSSQSAPEGTRSTATSRPLIDRARADDPAAWKTLVELYAPLVFAWCRRYGLPEQEIADVSQDVFHAVSAHIATFRKQAAGDTFRGWLNTITRNKVRDHFRALGHEPAAAGGTDAQLRFAGLPEDPPRVDDSAQCEDTAERELLRRVLSLIRNEFEPRTWQAFWLTTVDGRDAAHVADELGISSGAVRVAKSRVLRRLREELGEL
jgi:RNA polymerase sigma-70 factor (ECF subfamily)